MIFLWDELKDYILVSKYDPLLIGTGEARICNDNDDDEVSDMTECNTTTTKSSRLKSPNPKKKKVGIEDEVRKMVKIVVSLVMDDNQSRSSQNTNEIEQQSLGDLTELYKMYMSNFKFHKENGAMSK